MTGARITVELDADNALAMLYRTERGALSARPLFTEIGSALEASTRERISDTKLAPDGTPWLDISPDWKATKKERGQLEGILTMRGDLLNSIAFEAGDAAVDIIAGPTDYAAIDQFGGQAGRNRATTIPARPYLGVSAEDAAEIDEATRDWLARLTQG